VALTGAADPVDGAVGGVADVGWTDPVADLFEALSQARRVGVRVFGDESVAQTLADADHSQLGQASPAELRRVAALYRASAEAAKVARREAATLFDLVTKSGALGD